MSLRERNNVACKKHHEKERERELSLEYELFATKYHHDSLGHATWHWSVVPEDELFKAGWLHDANKWRMMKRLKKKQDRKIQEYGLDGLSRDEDGHYYGLQEKCYMSRSVTAYDLGTFYQTIYMRLKQQDPMNSGFVYYTSKLQVDVRDDSRNADDISFVKLPYKKKVKQPEDVVDPSTFKLYKYQKNALQSLMKADWEGSELLSMPCGCGKTIILGNYLKEKRFPIVILLSPTRVLAKQNFERISCFLKDYKCLLIDCDADGTRDVEEIGECMDKNDFVFLSSTYKSVDVLEETMACMGDMYDDAFLCVDECHNIDETIEEFIDMFPQCLQMSATPATVLDVPILHQLPFKDAIDQGYITDYNVYIPCVSDKTSGISVELKDLDTDFAVQAEFLATGMLRKGCRRVIAYHSTKEECYRFNDTIKKVFEEYHNEPFEGHVVVEDTSQREREAILKKFDDIEQIGSHYSVISSVRVLCEGIDLPLCDGVFLAKPSTKMTDSNTRRTIQILNRSTRKHRSFPSKIAKCFLFCDDMHDVGSVLQMLKTNDVDFGKKVHCMSSSYDGAYEKEEMDKETDGEIQLQEYVVGMNSLESAWMQKYKLLEMYIKKYNKYPISKEIYIGVNLGNWCCFQKHVHKEGNLADELKEKLEALPNWIWWERKRKKLTNWVECYSMVQIYINEHMRHPPKSVEIDGVSIGVWCSCQRYAHRTGRLTDERKEKLEALLGWEWAKPKQHKDPTWEETYTLLETYILEENMLPPSDTNKNGVNIGSWCKIQRNLHNQGVLKQQRKERLEALPMWSWGHREDIWDNKYNLLKQFIQTFDRLPIKNDVYEDVKIGGWFSRERHYYKKNKYTEERMKKMEAISGWCSP